MSIGYAENKAVFTSVIYEDEVVSFRDFLQEKAGEELEFDFTKCEDIHFAVLQLVMAYKKNYDSIYEFGNEKKLFEVVLKGFDSSENHCNK
jgi:hypothetical protein